MKYCEFTFRTILGIVVGILANCNNECSFHERCSGQVREICGHADQIIGRKVERIACEAPNSSCIEINSKTTACIPSTTSACHELYQSQCDGDILFRCVGFGTTSSSFVFDRCFQQAQICKDGCLTEGDQSFCAGSSPLVSPMAETLHCPMN